MKTQQTEMPEGENPSKKPRSTVYSIDEEIAALLEKCSSNDTSDVAEQKDDFEIFLLAARAGNIKIINYFLDKSLDNLPIQTDETGMNALHCAAKFGQLEVGNRLLTSPYAKDLIKADANGYNPLHSAMVSNQTDFAKMLLETEFAEILARGEFEQITKDGPVKIRTMALTIAAQLDQHEIGAILLKMPYAADLIPYCSNGENILFVAARNGSVKFGKMLIDSEFEIWFLPSSDFLGESEESPFTNNLIAANIFGCNPLFVAISSGQIEFAKMLLESRLAVDLMIGTSYTYEENGTLWGGHRFPFVLAAEMNQTEIGELMLKAWRRIRRHNYTNIHKLLGKYKMLELMPLLFTMQ